jgi:hypothetical protein
MAKDYSAKKVGQVKIVARGTTVWTSVAYMDVGKGREQERKLTTLRGVQELEPRMQKITNTEDSLERCQN